MTASSRQSRFWRRGSSEETVKSPLGLWAQNRERILSAVEALPDLPWAVRLVVDDQGRDTGFAMLRGRVPEAERSAFEAVASTHRLIGTMECWGFPRPEYSWAGESYALTPGAVRDDRYGLPEVAACEAWAHCAREPQEYVPSDRPCFLMSTLDFVDIAGVRQAAFGPWPDMPVAKRWDVLCAYSDSRYGSLVENWSLGRRCVEVLAGELGLRILLLGRSGIADVPDLPNVEVRPHRSHDEVMGCIARSRVTLVPNHMDPSPRILTESLAAGVPVLVQSRILGGWRYVHPETGAFFEGAHDVASGALRCLSGEHRSLEWLERSCGRDRAAEQLASDLRTLGGADDLRYALPTSLFR
ncbi:MAG: hypothetical protein ACLQK4_13125 [Acidimicrobiales bacterium]|jgi:hypothetical protein